MTPDTCHTPMSHPSPPSGMPSILGKQKLPCVNRRKCCVCIAETAAGDSQKLLLVIGRNCPLHSLVVRDSN